MADWLWVICLFLSLSMGYLIGFATGTYKNSTDIAPTENAYIREVETNVAAYKEIELRKAELDYQMRMEIYRGEKEKNCNPECSCREGSECIRDEQTDQDDAVG